MIDEMITKLVSALHFQVEIIQVLWNYWCTLLPI